MFELVLPKVESVASGENYARYHIEPLEPGFGTTLGNALRRVLLSSLPGAAITSIKIDGVYHEFAHIDHVREDATELVLNVKGIRLRSFTDRPVRLMLEATGPGRITAGDITCPPDVEIVNPELHLATLDAGDAKLVMEFTVEKGKGFTAAETHEGMPIGVIPVDAIFTPTRRVNYVVEHTRIGQVTTYDRLVLEVWTDGTITPEEALAQSAQILVRHLNLLADMGAKPVSRIEKAAHGPVSIPAKVYDTPIEDLDLSVRAYNCLKRAGITKVGQVLQMTQEDLLGVRNFGRKSLDELRERLQARGLLENSRLAPTEEEEAEAEEAELEPEMAATLGEAAGIHPVETEIEPEPEEEEIEDFTRLGVRRHPGEAKEEEETYGEEAPAKGYKYYPPEEEEEERPRRRQKERRR